MQDWINQNFPVIFPFFFVGMWIVVGYWVALVGGWRLLAKRFRLQATFTGQSWTMQSARMRWLTRYNNALTIGADTTGLFMVPFLLFRAGHPPLFVPWSEISDVRETQFLFIKFVEMRLGRAEEVPFRIRASLAAKIQAAAGPEWPANFTRALTQPPPPIG
jgi:hypothetical protein